MMIGLSIRRKIMGIAVVLIVLMIITAILSMVLVIQVGDRLQELTNSYTRPMAISRGRLFAPSNGR